MKFKIEDIKNGFVVTHDMNSSIWEDEVYFKTINQAISYVEKELKKYRRLRNE